MKRLLLRVAALGIVVVLGVIAIAQAQRGQTPAPADAAPALLPAADPAAKPLVPPGDSESNPLRDQTLRGSPVAGRAPSAGLSPAGRVVSTSSEEDTLGMHPPHGPAADPFSMAGPMRPIAAPDPDAASSGEGWPDADPPQDRFTPSADGSLYPELVGPGGGPGMSGSVEIADASGDERYPAIEPPHAMPGGDRYAPGGAAAAREPARLDADPRAAPAWPESPAAPRHLAPPGGEATPGLGTIPDARGLADAGAPLGGAGGEGSGRPGAAQLEGPQTPQVTIQKIAPEQMQVGKPATFRILVRNTGTVPAGSVEVRDEVPLGTRLLETSPRASRGVRDELVWQLGTLQPAEQHTIEVRLMPVAEGEIGSVATVTFCADASARAVATKPELAIQTVGPPRVLIGEDVTLTITVSNPGSGTATGVVLETHLPVGLQHAAGTDLEYEVGDLPPGESRKLELTLSAVRPGVATNVLVGRADANLRVEDRLDVEVVAPQLAVAVEGPRRRYLEREATYQVAISNPGTAPAEQVDLVAYLPPGLRFVSANNAGYYDEHERVVRWRLEELPVRETGTVELVTLPVEPGEQSLRIRSTAERGATAEAEQPVVIEGIAAIHFQVADLVDPVEVGGETTYEVRVVNQGSKASSNVRLALLFPPEMRPTAAEGPTRHTIEGNRVLFEGLARLAPKAETTYRVRARGLQPGDLRVQVQLLTDEMRSPVSKEESTRVYADE
jgi:uncharacterized repeat protein (TIGR01451 family)